MVKIMADWLPDQGYSHVKAHIKDYETPRKTSWKNSDKYHIPDLTAYKEGVLQVFEVEMCDAIGSTHSDSQWKLFSAYAECNKGSFSIVVPQACKSEAEQHVRNLGITAKVWTI